MKKIINLILILSILLISCITTQAQHRNVWRVENGQIVTNVYYDYVSNMNVPRAAKMLFAKNNTVGTMQSLGNQTFYGTIKTPVICTTPYADMSAVVDVEISIVNGRVYAKAATRTITASFYGGSFKQSYNPANAYPVNRNNSGGATYIEEKDLKKTFDSLIAHMNSLLTSLEYDLSPTRYTYNAW